MVSGHEAGSDEPSFEHLDLAALGNGESTLLVYMGASTAGLIARRLLDAGWKPACPVIAVENASRDTERRVVAVYPMEVALHGGVPVATSVRERIRAAHRTTLTKDWYDVPL